jgi:hypothetical protein
LTPKDHNKLLGILHLVQGGINGLVLLVFLPIYLFLVFAVGQQPGEEGAAVFLLLFGLFFFFLFLLLALPPFIAGYGMLKGRSWSRTWGIISAITASLSFPYGTALCVYTLWFLFGEGRDFHAAAQAGGASRPGSLGAGQPLGWDARQATRHPRPGEYVPPPQPPDWRGQP